MGNTTVNLLSLDIEGAEIQVEKAIKSDLKVVGLVAIPKPLTVMLSKYAYYFQVLETIPWKILDIEVILVETDHLGEVFPGSRHQLHSFFNNNGYEYVATICKRQNCSPIPFLITSIISDVDDVFVRRDLNDKYKVEKSVAEEFSDIYSFNPLLDAYILKKDEL